MIVSLDRIKEHLLIEQDIHEDDLYLMNLEQVACDAVKKRLSIEHFCEVTNDDGEIAPDVIHMILLLIGTLYNNREATTPVKVDEIPLTFSFLASLNKNYNNEFCND